MYFLTSSDELLDLLYLFPKKLARYILRKKAKVFLNEILENLSRNMSDIFHKGDNVIIQKNDIQFNKT